MVDGVHDGRCGHQGHQGGHAQDDDGGLVLRLVPRGLKRGKRGSRVRPRPRAAAHPTLRPSPQPSPRAPRAWISLPTSASLADTSSASMSMAWDAGRELGEAVGGRVWEGVGELGGWVAGSITPPPTHTHSLTWACAPAMQCAA